MSTESTQTRELVFEIGTEEMPSLELYKATEQMRELVTKALEATGLSFSSVECLSTPRRLTTFVHDLAESTEPVSKSWRGPAAAIAFDESGAPTKAAAGFARGKGIDPADLVVREEGGKPYVWADVSTPAMPAAQIVPGVLADAASKLSWHRSQRWGSHTCRFVRPVRWLVCLFGDEVIPVEFCDLVAGRTTRGHRLMDPVEVQVPSAGEYLDTLRGVHVMVSASERAETIRAGIEALCAERGLVADTPKRTFDEVVNLVEWPTVVMADFDREFLDVPHEIICESMLSNQRYFPLYDADHALTNHFVVVSNGDPACNDTIAAGNERVVRARLADAKFFYEEDLKRPLEAYVERLAQVGFQEKLGTMLDKTRRVESLAGGLAAQAGCDEATTALARRAAHLAKADLVTGAVVEFTSQQGVMGGYYAAAAGEDAQVALAVAQHYRPRFAGDELPENLVGKLVAMADKLDTVCGIFAIGEAPTGSSDPFAVRRAAIGIINICRAVPALSLGQAIEDALGGLAGQGIAFERAEVAEQVRAFFVGRLATMARDEGAAPDTVEAVRAVGVVEPVAFLGRTEALESARRESPELFDDLASAYTRANNLRKPELGTQVDEGLLGQSEAALLAAVDQTGEELGRVLASPAEVDYPRAMAALARLRAPIDAFFDDVMVMDPDPALRDNRLRILNRFIEVFRNVADVGKMEKKA